MMTTTAKQVIFPTFDSIVIGRKDKKVYILLPLTEEYINYMRAEQDNPSARFSIAGISFTRMDIVPPSKTKKETDYEFITRIRLDKRDISSYGCQGVVIPDNFSYKTNSCDKVSEIGIGYTMHDSTDVDRIGKFYLSKIGNPFDCIIIVISDTRYSEFMKRRDNNEKD